MRRRRRNLSAVAVLGVMRLVVAVGLLQRERELTRVEQTVLAYVGDLKTWRLRSAARRIDPDYLLQLKQDALILASDSERFRDELLSHLFVSRPEEAMAVPKEKFFEFLVQRVRRLHPELVQALVRGRIVGMEATRSGSTASATVTMELTGNSTTPRWFVLKTGLVRRGNTWFIVL